MREEIYKWLKTKTWILEEKENYFEYRYEKCDYEDYMNPTDVSKIINEDTKEKRYNKFHEVLEDCNFHDYENETIHQMAKEFCNDNNKDFDTISDEFIEIEDTIWDLIVFNYDTYLDDTYKVNILIDFNNQDGDTELCNSSNLDNCRKNNLYTLLRKQGYTKKDYLNNIKKLVKKDKYNYDYDKIVENGGSRFLTSVYEEINNNFYNTTTTLVVLKNMSLRELIENEKILINIDNNIGLFNWYLGSGSLLEIQLEKDFEIDRNKDIFTIQVEGSRENVGYSVNEVFGLIGSCWKE